MDVCDIWENIHQVRGYLIIHHVDIYWWVKDTIGYTIIFQDGYYYESRKSRNNRLYFCFISIFLVWLLIEVLETDMTLFLKGHIIVSKKHILYYIQKFTSNLYYL